MISTHLMGGLGNMLFQIAAGYSHSFRMQSDFVLSDANASLINHTPIKDYKDNGFRNLKFIKDYELILYRETSFEYKELHKVGDIFLFGYFQSEKYFSNHSAEIRELFSPRESDIRYLHDKYGDVGEYTSIHIRRGDYLNLQNHHPSCTLKYYSEAISKFDGKFLVFSDDIEWCKENFKGTDFIFIEGNLDYQDLYLMSICKNNIIANSSFSWWGAWLNTNSTKQVICPKQWFGPLSKNNTKDLIPTEWETL